MNGADGGSHVVLPTDGETGNGRTTGVRVVERIEQPYGRTVVPERPFAVKPSIEHMSATRQASVDRGIFEQMFDSDAERPYDEGMADKRITPVNDEILEFIESQARDRGLPAIGARDRRGGRPHLPLHGAQPPQHAQPARLPPPRPHQAPGDRGPLGPELGRGDGTPPGAPRAARRRRRRRHRRARAGERRGTAAGPARLHGRGRPVHAPRPRRLDDRARHPRRRLRDRRPAADRQEGRHRRRRHPGRRSDRQDLPAAATARSCSCPPTRRCSRWSSTRRRRRRSTAASSP